MNCKTLVLVELFDSSIQELNAPFRIAQVQLVLSLVAFLSNMFYVLQMKCLKIGEIHYGVSNHLSHVWDDLADCLTESVSRMEAIRG
jgi:hypothetical protein